MYVVNKFAFYVEGPARIAQLAMRHIQEWSIQDHTWDFKGNGNIPYQYNDWG